MNFYANKFLWRKKELDFSTEDLRKLEPYWLLLEKKIKNRLCETGFRNCLVFRVKL